MAAYVLARVTVNDPERYKDYTKETPGLAAEYGGEFIVRGGDSEVLEGPEENRRLVIVKFPDSTAARAFYHDPRYQEVAKIRHEAADSEFVLVEGV